MNVVPFQVISERLFSPMSSRHSSLSNDSEPGNVEEKTETSMASTFIESENHAKQKPKLGNFFVLSYMYLRNGLINNAIRKFETFYSSSPNDNYM